MHTSAFFKIFPPPKFLMIRYSGLDISDDSIHCLEYAKGPHGLSLGKYARTALPAGLIDGGDIKDEKKLAALLAEFDKTHELSYVKVSIPEEKAYLFETEIPGPTDVKSIEQHIEFKLEENVPLAAADAVFYFDLIYPDKPGQPLRASVSVVPRTYIERYISLLRGAGISPVAFEIAPRALCRAILPHDHMGTELFVHLMDRKAGMYVVSRGVVSFTSTLLWGNEPSSGTGMTTYIESIAKEVGRIQTYLVSKGGGESLDSITLVGKGASDYEAPLGNALSSAGIRVHLADVWQNAFNLDRYVPPISKDESLEYAVAAGLALLA